MALGYCMVCDELRTIRPGPQKWGSRECAWYPTIHWVNVHDCGAIVWMEGLSDNEYPTAINCPRCGDVNLDSLKSIQCPGITKEIK